MIYLYKNTDTTAATTSKYYNNYNKQKIHNLEGYLFIWILFIAN